MKGNTTIQFSWIFIFIVGAVLLIFFINIVNNQEEQSNTGIAIEVLQRFGNLVKGAESSPDTVKYYNVPDLDYEVTCANGISELTTDDKSFALDISQTPLFASKISGSKLLTWTQPFELPYKSTTLTYLTTPEIKYVFVESNQDIDEVQEITSKIPEGITVELADNIEERGYEETVKIKCCDGTFPTVGGLKQRAIKLEGRVTDPYVKGTVTFEDTKEREFIGLPMLLGAIIAETGEEYECNTKKVLEAHQRVGKFIQARAEKISTTIEEENIEEKYVCSTLLTTGAEIITELTQEETFIQDAEENSKTIIAFNEDLIRAGSCPRLY